MSPVDNYPIRGLLGLLVYNEAPRVLDSATGGVSMAYSYQCREYPGLETCPGSFTAETEEELWQHIELHAATAHQEDPAQWSPEDRRQVKEIIRST